MCLFIIQQHLEYNGVPDFDMYPIQGCPLTLRCGLHDMLQAMLQSQHLPTRLKVLTIANELLYDDSACQTLASKAAFLNVDLAEHDPEEEPNMALELAAANANILASEFQISSCVHFQPWWLSNFLVGLGGPHPRAPRCPAGAAELGTDS